MPGPPSLPQEFTFFLTQVTSQPYPSFSALSCSSADLGTHGCQWCVGSQGGSVPPLSQGSPCLLCPLPTHTLWGLNMMRESGCTQVCGPGKGAVS